LTYQLLEIYSQQRCYHGYWGYDL